MTEIQVKNIKLNLWVDNQKSKIKIIKMDQQFNIGNQMEHWSRKIFFSRISYKQSLE